MNYIPKQYHPAVRKLIKKARKEMLIKIDNAVWKSRSKKETLDFINEQLKEL